MAGSVGLSADNQLPLELETLSCCPQHSGYFGGPAPENHYLDSGGGARNTKVNSKEKKPALNCALLRR